MDDKTREELLRHRDLTEMMRSNGWEIFAQQVQRKIDKLAGEILKGQLDPHEYMAKAALHKELSRLLEFPVRETRRLEESEE